MAANSNEQTYMSSRDAMRYLNVGSTKFWSLVYGLALPSYRVGRLHRFLKADLDSFMEANRYLPGERK